MRAGRPAGAPGDPRGRAPEALQRLPRVQMPVGQLDRELLLLRYELSRPLAALTISTPDDEPSLLPINPEADGVRHLLSCLRGQARGTRQFTIVPQRR